AGQCDLLIVLTPVGEDRWLPLACERDVRERGWDAGAAHIQNTRKAATSAALLASSSLSVSVQIDPVSWTWFLPDCGKCEELVLNFPAQPRVTVPGCKAR